MDFIIVGAVAFVASWLTFFSGFGLGTLLLPAFALFFSAPVALAATGIVHLLNNLFKGGILRKYAHWQTVFKFGLPAIPSAILGALALTYLDERVAATVIGVVLITFAILELQPWFQRISFPKNFVFLGGIATGFMGGISGQQGALRSMFLLKFSFEPRQYIATGVLIAVFIDLARVPTYFLGFVNSDAGIGGREIWLVAFGALCAILGAWMGAQLIQKTTITAVRYIVASLMIVIGVLLILGILGT